MIEGHVPEGSSLRGELATKQSRGFESPWVATPLVAARDDEIYDQSVSDLYDVFESLKTAKSGRSAKPSERRVHTQSYHLRFPPKNRELVKSRR